METNKSINQSLNLLARSAVIVFFSIFLSKIFNYIYRVIIARKFGPEVYGTYSLAVSLLGICLVICLCGFDSGIVRFIPRYRAKNENNHISYIFKLSSKVILTTSIILGVILFYFSDIIALNIFHEERLIIYLKLFSLLIPIGAFTGFFTAFLSSYEKIGWYSFIENILTSFANVFFLLILFIIGFKANSVPISYLLGSICVFLVAYFVVKKVIALPKKANPLKEKEKNQLRKEFFAYSLPLLLFTTVNFIMGWIDTLSLGYFKTSREVGLYNAAVPLALLLNLAPELFIRLFFPIVSKEYAKGNIQVIRELSKQVGKWIMIINIPLFLSIFLFPDLFVNLFFGKEYLSASIALRLLSINAFVFSLSKLANRLIATTGKSKLLLADISFAALLNIILNILLIPMPSILGIDNALGLNGAAIATVISNLALSALFFIQAKKDFSIIPVKRKLGNVLVAAIIASISFLFLRNLISSSIAGFITGSIFFIAIYFLLVLILKGLDKTDIQTAKSVVSQFIKKLPNKKSNL